MPFKHLATLGATILAAVLLISSVVSPGGAQPLSVTPGHVELGLTLRQLNTVGTFMMITAHPDDEHNALLALMAKGHGIRTVLLTATRGDGGQNEIGPELFDALAALRTEELLAAHRLDGAEQYFSRAVDFGYSFSQDETFERWGRDEILGDFVRVIRMVRPDVVTSMSPDGQFGGQHHQASAILAREAFRAAADPARYPEHLDDGLRPWQARKFYHSDLFPPGFRRRSATPPPADMTAIDLAGFDSLIGRSYAEIGSEARSMHKCQGMPPLLALPGPLTGRYRLVDSTVHPTTDVAEASLFDGVATSVPSLARFAGPTPPVALTAGLEAIARHARDAFDTFATRSAEQVARPVLMGLQAVRDLRAELATHVASDDARWEIDFRLAAKERQFEHAALLAHGLRVETLVDDGTVVPGQQVTLEVTIANQGGHDVRVADVTQSGFASAMAGCDTGVVEAGQIYRCGSTQTVPVEASVTDVHWRSVSGAARYQFDADVPFGVPFRPSPYQVALDLELGSVPVRLQQPVEYRYGDDVFAGEKRTELKVVPQLAVEVTPAVAVIPQDGEALEIRVTVTNAGRGPVAGEVTLDLPTAWTVTPVAETVRLGREDESRVARFHVSPGGSPQGDYRVGAVVTTEDGRFTTGYQVVEYSHTARRHLVHPAQATLKVLDIQMAPGLTVGYVEGVGDAVPPAIAQLGAAVEFIDTDTLAWGDLARFDVIVTGVRAYERRDDLRAHNGRLLEYVEDGGTLIVQYNKFEFNAAQYGPRPAKVTRDRVTDEHAPIRILAPDHPVFGWPNPITAASWSGWVQERGLYFLGDKDPAYEDLVELEDSFEWNAGVKSGALVEIEHGRGRWLYVGLGLWRQLPAGTAGAYQLLANLLSLGADRP